LDDSTVSKKKHLLPKSNYNDDSQSSSDEDTEEESSEKLQKVSNTDLYKGMIALDNEKTPWY
jgi:hypothetical protein